MFRLAHVKKNVKTYSKKPTGGNTPISFSTGLAFKADETPFPILAGANAETELAPINPKIAVAVNLMVVYYLLKFDTRICYVSQSRKKVILTLDFCEHTSNIYKCVVWEDIL